MSKDSIDPEMRRRFDAAEKTRIGTTALRSPALAPSPDALRAHFESATGRAQTELENPHVEPRVTEEQRAKATPASVLIGIVLREAGPTVVLTKRHPDISFPGHWVFPGGRADAEDPDPLATALREAEEEIGLAPDRVEVLGRLGDYVSHSGFRIAPVIALIEPPVAFTPEPTEVESIAEVPLAHLLDSTSYFVFRFAQRKERAHFALDAAPNLHSGDEEILLTGVTVSLCIGLYADLLKTQIPSSAN
ncbi:MAG: CoA pyrophosphatase [Myxococcota bacterium]